MAKPKDVVTQIKKATRRKFSAAEKIRIILEGFRGEPAMLRQMIFTSAGGRRFLKDALN